MNLDIVLNIVMFVGGLVAFVAALWGVGATLDNVHGGTMDTARPFLVTTISAVFAVMAAAALIYRGTFLSFLG